MIPWTLKSYYNAPTIKPTRLGPAGFLIILSSGERIILMSQTHGLLVPSVFSISFLRLKSVTMYQAVMAKMCVEQDVVSQIRDLGQETLAKSPWQCPPCDED